MSDCNQRQSTNFPTRNPYQAGNAGAADAFVSRINIDALPPSFTSISDDTGLYSTDQITSDQTLIFTGTDQNASGTVTSRSATPARSAPPRSTPATGPSSKFIWRI